MAVTKGLKTTGVRKALLAAELFSAKSKSCKLAPKKKSICNSNAGKTHMDIETGPQAQKSKRGCGKSREKLRSNITPGTVLILLAGRFRGRRVIFLKQLTSGLLLITGPYKINGVPLCRIPQSYVIATSTHVDISSVIVPETIGDDTFKRAVSSKKSSFIPKDDNMDINEGPKCSTLRCEAQKIVDAPIISEIKKTPMLSSYLSSLFSLRKGDAPHTMIF